MSLTQVNGLVSATFGVIGTIILFLASYSLQPFEGAVFGSDQLTEWNEKIKAKNASRVWRQRVGLAFLCLSFVIQAVAAVL